MLARVGAIADFVVVGDAVAVVVGRRVGRDRDLARCWVTDVDIGVVLAQRVAAVGTKLGGVDRARVEAVKQLVGVVDLVAIPVARRVVEDILN